MVKRESSLELPDPVGMSPSSSRTPRRQFRGAVPRKDPNASGLHPDFIGFDRTSGQIQKKKDEERKEEQHYKNTWKRAGGVNRMANPSLRGQVLPSTS